MVRLIRQGHGLRKALGLCAALLLLLLPTGCAAPLFSDFNVRLDTLLPADVILLGEQHDAPQHQRIHFDVIRGLADRGVLAAVAIEMAEQGNSTAALPRHATEDQVRSALQWRESEWPWARYGPAVMAAVRNGTPVFGANLPRTAMKTAMGDARLDRLLGGPALKTQQQLIRSGHCDLLPERQVGPMTRIQIARDVAMAQTITQALQPGKTVLLLAGSGHADGQLGVPLHLANTLRVKTLLLLAQTLPSESDKDGKFDHVWRTDPLLPTDYCARFVEQRARTSPSP